MVKSYLCIVGDSCDSFSPVPNRRAVGRIYVITTSGVGLLQMSSKLFLTFSSVLTSNTHIKRIF